MASDSAGSGATVSPDPGIILERLSIREPLIGFYDAPDPGPFAPLVEPHVHECVFASFHAWRRGKTLHLTKEKYGCGAPYLLGIPARDRQEMLDFLCDEEGLRATQELMGAWYDQARHYHPRHEHVLIGPLRPEQYAYLRTVTFFVNPDQLSVFTSGASYYNHPDEAEPVLAPWGSGCMQLLSLFADLDVPQAMIGATDQAMRKYLKSWMLTFTATKPMYERLCTWSVDRRSSLHTGFLEGLIRARGGTLS